jgi:3-deoxy-D-manno-octulosonate 8-phosphate phosphatase (KDO 8-P phosphatase)
MDALPEALAERARRIRLAVFDVDGVMTDGRLTYGPSGEATKTFDVRDGHGLVLLREAGIPVAVLSARDSEIVRTRMRELGVKLVGQGWRDKRAGLAWLLERTGLGENELSFMGDDVNDVPVLERVALAACPADATPEAQAVSHFVSSRPGGRGAVRELAELVLKAQGRWP